MEDFKIIDGNLENIKQFSLCGYKNENRDGYKEKLEWVKQNFSLGLKIKFLYSEKNGTQGMVEYMPSENSFRATNALTRKIHQCFLELT